jgi:hypothetical protein
MADVWAALAFSCPTGFGPFLDASKLFANPAYGNADLTAPRAEFIQLGELFAAAAGAAPAAPVAALFAVV